MNVLLGNLCGSALGVFLAFTSVYFIEMHREKKELIEREKKFEKAQNESLKKKCKEY